MSRHSRPDLLPPDHATRRQDDVTAWEPYRARGPLRVRETSCCGSYELCSEGGQYFVLRFVEGRHEEAGRGRYGEARQVWVRLVREHRCPRIQGSIYRRGVLAAERLGTTYQAVYAWAARDEQFAVALNTAQRAAAPPDTPHGTENGYRWCRCRCSDCRAAHSR
jgi:hypothetical protein